MNVTLVGSGNVAFVLSKLLVSAGHSICEVLGRNAETVNSIFRLTGAKVTLNFSDAGKETDLCILAVSDSAIGPVADQLNLKQQLIVHTSGAMSKEVLNKFSNYGVLYPLQSLRKEMETLPAIPFFIDANSVQNKDTLQQLALSTGNTVQVASDEERLRYHIAAVLCSNFTNHLYTLTQQFCDEEKIMFSALLPLINETALRLSYFQAAQMQTGPAIRHDELTIQKHLEVLQSYPHIDKLYRLLTQSIQNFSKKNI